MTLKKAWIVYCDGCGAYHPLSANLSKKQVDEVLKSAKVKKRGGKHFCNAKCQTDYNEKMQQERAGQ